MALADAALVASSTCDMRIAGDQAPFFNFRGILFVGVIIQTLHHGADFNDFAQEFMACDAERLLLALERTLHHVLKRCAVPQAAVGAAHARVANLKDDRKGVFGIPFLVQNRHRYLSRHKPAASVPTVFFEVYRKSFNGAVFLHPVRDTSRSRRCSFCMCHIIDTRAREVKVSNGAGRAIVH